jgi:hypothetical protein
LYFFSLLLLVQVDRRGEVRVPSGAFPLRRESAHRNRARAEKAHDSLRCSVAEKQRHSRMKRLQKKVNSSLALSPSLSPSLSPLFLPLSSLSLSFYTLQNCCKRVRAVLACQKLIVTPLSFLRKWLYKTRNSPPLERKSALPRTSAPTTPTLEQKAKERVRNFIQLSLSF